METFELTLLLLSSVLISSVIAHFMPRVSPPLIQIALGIVIAVLAGDEIRITLNPELFLVLFIAPLLYDEAKNADRQALWRDRKPVLSLAIGLVVASTLIIGFATHALIPSIPLAAAFALAAALGPTDAVAVTSLSKRINIPDRQKSILKGELLLNDASGIVSFQFALAAVITGTFSLADASVTFLYEFFGGLLVGIILGLISNFVVRQTRSIGLENTTFHVLFDLSVPFLVYLISTGLHVSGIIAVVIAGLMNVSASMTGPSISRTNIVSTSVWRVLSFALNGIVFVLLGTQLPKAMQRTWEDVSISNPTLIGYVLIITALLLGIRFIWVLVMECRHIKKTEKRPVTRDDVRIALATTLCGAKGTITLSIMLTLPTHLSVSPVILFPQRDLLIFLACGVIVCTLLLSTFVVPLLVPKPKTATSVEDRRCRENEVLIEILRSVIEELTIRQTPENHLETQQVIRMYNERIDRTKNEGNIEEEPNVDLRICALKWEKEHTFELIESRETPALTGYRYLNRLERREQLLKLDRVSAVRDLLLTIRSLTRRGFLVLARELPTSFLTESADEMRNLQIKAEQYAAKRLEDSVISADVPTEDASKLLLEYQRSIRILSEAGSITRSIDVIDRTNEVKALAYKLELGQIQKMYEDDRLCRPTAKKLRDNVRLMQIDLEESV